MTDLTTKPNAELAYRTLDYIDAHPDEWDQAEYVCGTKACFAGWSVILSGGRIASAGADGEVVGAERGSAAEPYLGWSIDGAAQHLLGVADIDAGWTVDGEPESWLFSESHDRESLGHRVAEIFGPDPRGGA